jgi:ABC-2 type transport system ATP-binding protein
MAGSDAAVTTESLTKRYGKVRALSEVTCTVPQGRVSALVGSNGAGKTTLLSLLAGLSAPSDGRLTVVGRRPEQSPEFLADIAFLAQELPLWQRFSALEHLQIGAHLNPRWDEAGAVDRLRAVDVPLSRPVQTLSGGQRAQVALTLALAKRPRLLLLDEPVAALDPLARRQFLAGLAEAVATEPLTVLISSHLIKDLELVCDHLILLAASRVQLCDDIDDILARHLLLVGPRRDTDSPPPGQHVVEARRTARQTTLLVRATAPLLDPAWQVSTPTLEEIVLGYMSRGQPTPDPALRPVPEPR